MGNVMSRLATMLRRKKVSPNQVSLPQMNLNHDMHDKLNQLMEKSKPETQQHLKYISTIEDASVVECGEVFSSLNASESGGCPQPIKTDEVVSKNNGTVENHFTEGFCDFHQRSEMEVSLNDTKSMQKEMICINDTEEETLSPAEEIVDNEDLHGTLDTKHISAENTIGSGTSLDISYSSGKGDILLSQVIHGSDDKIDSLSWISRDGYSTEGTVGSVEGSFGDRDDEIIERLLVDNTDDVAIDAKNFDTMEEVSSGQKSALTPLGLETLNGSEIDKHECVRSYIQACSPLNLPTMGTTSYLDTLPGACSDLGTQAKPTLSNSHERFQFIYDDPVHANQITSCEPRELHEVDSEEFSLFYPHLSEPVSKPLSDSWNLLKNDRAPWINMESAGTNEVIQGRGGFTKDEEGSGWPKTAVDGRQDPSNRLTLCSLSTINEESDGADRIDQL